MPDENAGVYVGPTRDNVEIVKLGWDMCKFALGIGYEDPT